LAIRLTQTYDTPVAALWPANAILLAALLRHEPATWPIFALLTMTADTAAALINGGGAVIAVGIAACDTFEALLAVMAVRWSGGLEPPFGTGWQMLRFSLVGGMLPPAASATIGTSLVVLLEGAPFAELWQVWYVANTLGLLIVTPFLLSWTDPTLQHGNSTRTLREASLLAGLTFVAAALIFGQERVPLGFLAFPLMLLATFRAGLPGATASAVALAGVAIWSTLQGHGPLMLLASADVTARLQLLQLFLATVVLSTLPVAAALAEREASVARLQEAEKAGRRGGSGRQVASDRERGEFEIVLSRPLWRVFRGAVDDLRSGGAELDVTEGRGCWRRSFVVGSGRLDIQDIHDQLIRTLEDWTERREHGR
jgi:integral membrane sensor domain MASE1